MPVLVSVWFAAALSTAPVGDGPTELGPADAGDPSPGATTRTDISDTEPDADAPPADRATAPTMDPPDAPSPDAPRADRSSAPPTDRATAPPTGPAEDAAAPPPPDPDPAPEPTLVAGPGRRGLSWRRAGEPTPQRRFFIALEGVVAQTPPLRPDIVRFDPRFIGRSVSLAGLGLTGRLRVHPRIGVEAVVRSGSVRYAGRDDEQDDVVSQDQVMADLGVLLFVARGDVAHLAFDAGVGGIGTRVSYELTRSGTQRFGSALVRVGADAEFLVKRIAFLVSVRAYGVLTDRERVRNRGALFEAKDPPAPVPARQTYLVASAGIGYRF